MCSHSDKDSYKNLGQSESQWLNWSCSCSNTITHYWHTETNTATTHELRTELGVKSALFDGGRRDTAKNQKLTIHLIFYLVDYVLLSTSTPTLKLPLTKLQKQYCCTVWQKLHYIDMHITSRQICIPWLPSSLNPIRLWSVLLQMGLIQNQRKHTTNTITNITKHQLLIIKTIKKMVSCSVFWDIFH